MRLTTKPQHKFSRLVEKIAKRPFYYQRVVLTALVIATLRAGLEVAAGSATSTLALIAQFFSWNMYLCLAIAEIVARNSGQKRQRVLNVLSYGLFLVVAPPVLDYLGGSVESWRREAFFLSANLRGQVSIFSSAGEWATVILSLFAIAWYVIDRSQSWAAGARAALQLLAVILVGVLPMAWLINYDPGLNNQVERNTDAFKLAYIYLLAVGIFARGERIHLLFRSQGISRLSTLLLMASGIWLDQSDISEMVLCVLGVIVVSEHQSVCIREIQERNNENRPILVVVAGALAFCAYWIWPIQGAIMLCVFFASNYSLQNLLRYRQYPSRSPCLENKNRFPIVNGK